MSVNIAVVNKLNQQIAESLQRLENLSHQTEQLSWETRQSLAQVRTEISQTLQQLQVALNHLRQQNQELITTQVAIEAEYRRYEELFVMAPNPYLVTDSEATILEANEAAAGILQLSRDRLVGQGFDQFVAASHQRQFTQQLKKIQRGQSATNWPLTLKGCQNRTFDVTFDVVPVIGSQGQVAGMRWQWHSVSAKKEHQGLSQTTELLKANEQLKHEIALRQEAEAALRYQRERERFMGAIAHRIRQSLNLDEILNTTVAEVRQFLETDRVIIYRFEPDWSGVVIVESVGIDWVSLLGRSLMDECLGIETCINSYAQGRIQALADIHQAGLAKCYVELLNQFQVKANLVVPILQTVDPKLHSSPSLSPRQPQPPHNRLWGLLVAQHCQEPREWQPLDIELLEQFAEQVAIAIQQSELYEQVQQLNTHLEEQVRDRTAQLQQSLEFEATIKCIAEKVRDSLDENHILQTVVEELAQALDATGGNSALYDINQMSATITYEQGEETSSQPAQVIDMTDFWEGYQQLLAGESFQFCVLKNSERETGTRLVSPIVDAQGILGDLCLYKPAEQTYNANEIRLVQQVANQCAIAIRQARLYQAAQAQVEELQKLSQLKDDFLSTVSHELRTPIANMKMAIQMLAIALNQQLSLFADLAKPPAQRSKVGRYFHILHSECERETSLINNLLDLQRVEAGVQTRLLAAIDLQEWLPQLIEPFYEVAKEHEQILELEIPDELPRFVCDRSSLGRIVTELATNACKYTPAGERIRFQISADAEQMHLSVTNFGVQIPEPELPRIFEKFYRIPSADPWKKGGTGLGLALVQKLVTYLEGTIEVTSGEDQTCFTVNLPMK